MKVGIITYHDTTNFGAWLQAYALSRAMRDLGIETEVIDYQCDEIVRREVPPSLASCGTPKQAAVWAIYGRHVRRKHLTMQGQASELMMLSDRRYVRADIVDANECYDAFLVGSDMLWAPEINGGDTTYLLDFVVGKHRKYAFATSMGKPWTEEWEASAKVHLAGFDRIALREREGADRVEHLVGRRPEWVCDPTMLINSSVWSELAGTSRYAIRPPATPGYVLVYFAYGGTSTLEDAKAWAAERGMRVLHISTGLPRRGVRSVWPCSVQDFLWLVQNAGAVFTGSYHGLLFSLYFCRDVYFYGRGSDRFSSVSAKLGIGGRYMRVGGEVEDIPLNWQDVCSRIELWRKDSLATLASFWPQSGRETYVTEGVGCD